MNDIKTEYDLWKQNVDEPDLKNELLSIDGDSAAIEERFCKGLEFGTGGMRGIIGVGLNRINIYTARKATQGLANFLNSTAIPEENKVVIAYDSRHMSKEFALESALVLAQNGIKTYVFEKITPTPLLSFAVRELGCSAGIVITASHNSKEYNGYKVYNHHGGQVTEKLANTITAEIEKINNVFEIKTATQSDAEKKGLLVFLNDDVMDKYLEITKALILDKGLLKNSASELNIVYSPLHGSGLVPLTKLFCQAGFSNLNLVQQQAIADPDFPTVVFPNPEDQAACKLAIQNANSVEADITLLTDPDADRIGIVVKNNHGEYIQLTGNQTGALLIDYLLHTLQRQGSIPQNGVIVKTIVTSNMGAEIAASYGVKHIDVLTGFKYIGEKIAEFESSKEYTFLFGYEESCGYLIKTHARDKDAVQTALMLAEMALSYKKNNISIYERLLQLFEKFGYYQEDLINIQFDGLKGQQKIADIMNDLRAGSYEWLTPYGITAIKDYLSGSETAFPSGIKNKLELPSSNVIYFILDKGAWCCIRPSGTEPKLKIYLGVRDKTAHDSQKHLEELKQAFFKFLEPYSDKQLSEK